MRTQADILADMATTHKQYFDHLTNHGNFMQTLTRLRQLEAELVEAVGNKYDAYHLEHLSYMSAMDGFMEAKNKVD